MSTQADLDDPLSNLRRAIAASKPPILTTTPTPSSADDTVTDLSLATHISFNNDSHPKIFEITTPTRFTLNDQPVELRSIYFAWLNKDASLPDYISAVQRLNEDLPSGAGGSVQNIAFAQKVDLVSWLNGELENSEFIAPLDGAAAVAAAESSAAIASGKAGVPVAQIGAGAGKTQKMMDARLMEIYQGERKMGDHNSVLRGTKPVDFSPFRKTASTFLRSRPNPSTPVPTTHPHPSPLVSNLQKKPARRLEPIILVSPSASSLLRMSNIKSFLDTGVFIPPNATETTSANLLHLNRILPSIDATRPLRFILVDSTQNFKPPYWARVVAIFTTGQTWQFKSYKYPNPSDLFVHYPGVYVGWQGEEPPDNVQAWGRGVLSVKVDKWTGGSAGRWRDREVVEMIWGRIEEGMRRAGWGRDGPGMVGQGAGR
ncbi:CDC73-domain-containing protein [Lindgomyces ingoldianus]|uniref:CDC73-domain-containing protein n=1 Tax=Lindgomyces ingoldianus TaxID=673940 RepID=A0ACB6R9A3_9PLEO|nr:CDC73-domain-containing protein [Lindgomyces ingoldianus]KAF2475839.1 CDC73-domain-containing protein [Lindgomyces ingoldianus]